MESSSTPTPVSLDGLLIHAEWVRGLARALVRDEAGASDVEQEVWREAIERPPASSSNVRGWLAQVARNAARMQMRSSRRAQAREMTVARPEALPSTLDVVAEAELSRSLAGQVIALEEPYRTTLLLRYFRGQSVDEIASVQGVSRESVRTRQRRGLELLRAKLDAEHEGRAKWMEALIPLTRTPTIPAAAATSILIGGAMSLLTWSVAGAVVVAVAWFAWPRSSNDVQIAAHTEAPTPLPGTSGDASVHSQASAPGSQRSGALDSLANQPAATTGGTKQLRATLADWRGTPIVHEEIEFRNKTEAVLRDGMLYMGARSESISPVELDRLRSSSEALDNFLATHPPTWGLREVLLGRSPERPHVFSANDGVVNIDLPVRAVDLFRDNWTPELVDARHLLVRGHRDDSDVETWIVVPSAPVAGIVVDADGAPVVGVHVWTPITLEALPDFAFPSHVANWRSSAGASSDESGRFAIDRAPVLPRHRLRFEKRGFETKEAEIPESGNSGMRIQLDREVDKNPHVRGLVLEADGTPAFKALVQLGQDSASTDEQGRFDIKLTSTMEGAPLTATKQGSQPAIVPDVGRNKMEAMDDVVLRLGPATLAISGTVLDAGGEPVPNCLVQILDGTPSGTSIAFVEDVADGHRMIGKECDRHGHFQIGGLFPREYHLLARDEKRGLIAWSGPIAAGSRDVVLRNDPSDFSDIEGRVVTRRGVALGGAEVAISLPVFHIGTGASSVTYGNVKADAAGRFHLHGVPHMNVQVCVSGDGIEYSTHELPELRTGVIEVVAALSVRVKLEVADSTIDHVEFLDEGGKTVVAWCHLQNTESAFDRIPRGKSGFPSFNLSDAAVTATLFRGKEEVRRTPVEIRRVELLVLDL